MCSEYDGTDNHKCTEGFPSLFHIDEVVGNTYLYGGDSRQVLIPDIRFKCSGVITRWIFGAQWQGQSPAHTELQIWRKSPTNDNMYNKIDGTTVVIGTKNISDIYEYPVDSPLAFQEGDILGYFQAIRNRSEIVLYLEQSYRISAYYERLSIIDIQVPSSGVGFSLDSASTDSRYPVVAVRTGICDAL